MLPELDLGSSMEMHLKDLACLAKLEPGSALGMNISQRILGQAVRGFIN